MEPAVSTAECSCGHQFTGADDWKAVEKFQDHVIAKALEDEPLHKLERLRHGGELVLRPRTDNRRVRDLEDLVQEIAAVAHRYCHGGWPIDWRDCLDPICLKAGIAVPRRTE